MLNPSPSFHFLSFHSSLSTLRTHVSCWTQTSGYPSMPYAEPSPDEFRLSTSPATKKQSAGWSVKTQGGKKTDLIGLLFQSGSLPFSTGQRMDGYAAPLGTSTTTPTTVSQSTSEQASKHGIRTKGTYICIPSVLVAMIRQL